MQNRQSSVHGDIRHLEIEQSAQIKELRVHGDIRHLENHNS